MDLASLIGFIGAVGMILAAMIAGGGVAPFIDTQSILIVFGGLVSLSDKRFRLVVQRKNKDDANFVDASIKR